MPLLRRLSLNQESRLRAIRASDQTGEGDKGEACSKISVKLPPCLPCPPCFLSPIFYPPLPLVTLKRTASGMGNTDGAVEAG